MIKRDTKDWFYTNDLNMITVLNYIIYPFKQWYVHLFDTGDYCLVREWSGCRFWINGL